MDHVTQPQLAGSIDPLTHSTVDLGAVPIDPTIHDSQALPVVSEHIVIDPASGDPMLSHGTTLSPVGIAFAPRAEDDHFRRSTSVEQLEADYINFHVAEEPTHIDESENQLMGP